MGKVRGLLFLFRDEGVLDRGISKGLFLINRVLNGNWPLDGENEKINVGKGYVSSAVKM